jgi:hypothetical protein
MRAAADRATPYADLRAQSGWAAAGAALKEIGLIYSISGPHRVHVSDDVRFSLRYSDDGHIARELGEETPATAPGGRRLARLYVSVGSLPFQRCRDG